MKILLKKIKHFIEYVVFITITCLLRLLPIDISADFCAFIAKNIGNYFPVNKVVVKNLHIAFGDKCNKAKIIKELWDNFGRFIGEFSHLYNISEVELNKRVTIEGIENIAYFQDNNQPFLLFSGHFANWEFMLKILHKLYPKFAVVYRKANNPYVDKEINRLRNLQDVLLIEKGYKGSKALIKALKLKYSIAMLIDQKMNDGISVPFFGKDAMTAHAIAKIALQFNYPIIPINITRAEGSFFRINIFPQLKVNTTADTEEDLYQIMVQINNILEDWVIANPSQWFWFHRRWGKS